MKKIKKFTKNLFSANRMKMLAMMLLCGTAVTFAQNAAGDYTAGTNALSTVTEEIARDYRVPLKKVPSVTVV